MNQFKHLRISQLERIHMGVSHKIELLQEKMAETMGYKKSHYNILPRNFSILPNITKCSIDDLELLEELHQKSFDVHWTIELKKAEKKDELELYNAKLKFYAYIDILNDIELNEFYEKCKEYNNGSIMTSHDIIWKLKENPNFIRMVIA